MHSACKRKVAQQNIAVDCSAFDAGNNNNARAHLSAIFPRLKQLFPVEFIYIQLSLSLSIARSLCLSFQIIQWRRIFYLVLGHFSAFFFHFFCCHLFCSFKWHNEWRKVRMICVHCTEHICSKNTLFFFIMYSEKKGKPPRNRERLKVRAEAKNERALANKRWKGQSSREPLYCFMQLKRPMNLCVYRCFRDYIQYHTTKLFWLDKKERSQTQRGGRRTHKIIAQQTAIVAGGLFFLSLSFALGVKMACVCGNK